MNKMEKFRTIVQQKRAERERLILADYKKLIGEGKNAKTAIISHLCAKYIVSTGTVYKIIRLGMETENHEKEMAI